MTVRRRDPVVSEHSSSRSPYQRSVVPSSSAATPSPARFYRNHSVATSTPSAYITNGADLFAATAPRTTSSESPFHHTTQRRSSSSSSPSPGWWSARWHAIPLLVLALLPWYPPRGLHEIIRGQEREIEALVTEHHVMLGELDSLTESLHDHRRTIAKANHDNERRIQELTSAAGSSRTATGYFQLGTEEYAAIEQAEDALLGRIDDLEAHIRTTSAASVIEKHGPGPHRIRLTCTDPREASPATTIDIDIDLAPLEKMPHAVDLFLGMVALELWEGLSLILGGGSSHDGPFFTATPMEMDVRHGHTSWQGQRFADANLTQMAFTEHPPEESSTSSSDGSSSSSSSNSSKYVVGFSGHPGGPSWFLGPGSSYDDEQDVHQKPSVFGRVTPATEAVLDRFLAVPPKKSGARSTKSVGMLTIQRLELVEV